jgi:uncharacterized surface protein with fasciclin (FAS1) repeats
MIRSRHLLAPLLGASLLLAACGGDDNDEGTASATTAVTDGTGGMAGDENEMNIVETAVAADDFSTLAAALEAGGLVDTLSNDGPYTVFAPTDAAFDALPAGTLDDLLKPENKGKLADILKYHVVKGEVMAEDVVELDEATTVNGKPIAITVSGSTVTLNGKAKVVQTDIKAENGVIHVIDAVLLPPA